MPKRKSDCNPASAVSLTSLDAALDLLACETFSRLASLTTKFEAAAGLKLNDGVVNKRWDEAVRRYWVMKSMDDLCCSMSKPKVEDDATEVDMDGAGVASGSAKENGRPLPSNVHPGAVVVHGLNADEEAEWRRWAPKVGDVVLVETAQEGIWPGKIIDKKVFFQGRTQPRGNHFFCVRVYDDAREPTITVKSRLVPLHLRPSPPLLASTAILGAYNHANNPSSFDMRASARESLAAHQRTHPGVNHEPAVDKAKIKADKAAWNELVNWVMGERRVEKLRAVEAERLQRLKEVTKDNDEEDGRLPAVEEYEMSSCPKKRRTSVPLPPIDSPSRSCSPTAASIFGPMATTTTPKRTSSPANGLLRPSLAAPQRPQSPRRFADRRRSVYNGVGEYSPRGRGGTYTPPRILPSGDETAPFGRSDGSPAPTLQTFDFVSPLGPVKLGRLDTASPMNQLHRKGSLEVVREEATETDGWTLVENKRSKRAGSAPCRDKAKELAPGPDAGLMSVDA